MSANTNATLATLIKEIMAKMSDDLVDKKEIDVYYKDAMKKVKEMIKDDKKAAKDVPEKGEKKAKRVKKVEYDDDGNEIAKAKKPLTKYLMFIQDNRQKVKDENPNLSSKEYMVLLATLWNKHKEDTKTNKADDETEDNTDDDKKEDDDDKKEDDDDKKEDDKKKKEDDKKKKEKKPKKAKQDKQESD
jgi:hypothetical protein